MNSRFVVGTHIMVALTARKMFQEAQSCSATSSKLAESCNTNPVVIRRILGDLRKAGLVESKTGPNGGSVLLGDPTQITLAHVYRALDDGELFQMHSNQPNPHCMVGKSIQDSLIEILKNAEQAMVDKLGDYSLAQLASDTLERSGIMRRLAEVGSIEKLMEEMSGPQPNLA